MEVRILGSSRMLNPLKADAVPTIFSHQTETLYAFPVSNREAIASGGMCVLL